MPWTDAAASLIAAAGSPWTPSPLPSTGGASMPMYAIPDGVPSLSRGKHRSAKSGACFMEFASYLAGEPWSDSPQCTDPLLSHLARAVNDQLADDRRDEIAADIPRVIGLRGDHRILGPVIALRAAATALPVASLGRQHALAVALLSLPALLPSGVASEIRTAVRDALDAAPEANLWAQEHLTRHRVKERDLLRTGCSTAIQFAIEGIADACIDDPDGMLVQVLRDAITDVEDTLSAPEPTRTIVVGCLERI
ncbi:MAG: hypothetical protein ABI435_07740 [Pseudolysinimonas sp.]